MSSIWSTGALAHADNSAVTVRTIAVLRRRYVVALKRLMLPAPKYSTRESCLCLRYYTKSIAQYQKESLHSILAHKHDTSGDRQCEQQKYECNYLGNQSYRISLAVIWCITGRSIQ